MSYENPALIVDRSAAILSQGFASAAQSLAKGIDVYTQRYNERLEEQRKRAEQLKRDNSNAIIAAGKASQRFTADANKFGIKQPTAVTEDFINNIYLPKVQSLGEEYRKQAAIAYNPNNTDEQIVAANDALTKIESDLKLIQNKAANNELDRDSARDIVDNSGQYDFHSFGDLTAGESRLFISAVAADKKFGYVNENYSYRVTTDENDNEVYKFEPRNESVKAFEVVKDGSTSGFLENFASKGYIPDNDLATFNETSQIVGKNNMLNKKFAGTTETVTLKDGRREMRTVYNTKDILTAYTPFVTETTARLMSIDAQNPSDQNKTITGFLTRIGYSEEEINEVFSDNVASEQEINKAVETYVLNNFTSNKYKLKNDGNIYTVDSTLQPEKPEKLTDQQRAAMTDQQLFNIAVEKTDEILQAQQGGKQEVMLEFMKGIDPSLNATTSEDYLLRTGALVYEDDDNLEQREEKLKVAAQEEDIPPIGIVRYSIGQSGNVRRKSAQALDNKESILRFVAQSYRKGGKNMEILIDQYINPQLP